MFARGWLVRGRAKPFTVRVSFDPRHAGSVYLHMDGTEFGFELCVANHDRSRVFADPANEPSFWDADLEEFDRKDGLAEAKQRELRSGIELTAGVTGVVANALTRQDGVQDLTREEQVKGIRDNRRAERAIQQALDAMQFAPELAPPSAAPSALEVANDDVTDVDIDIFDISGERYD